GPGRADLLDRRPGHRRRRPQRPPQADRGSREPLTQSVARPTATASTWSPSGDIPTTITKPRAAWRSTSPAVSRPVISSQVDSLHRVPSRLWITRGPGVGRGLTSGAVIAIHRSIGIEKD